jgi:transposase
MPEQRYGPWPTCYDRLQRWQRDGTWQRVLQVLQGVVDAGRLPGQAVGWEGRALDNTSIKVHPHATGARKKPAKKV